MELGKPEEGVKRVCGVGPPHVYAGVRHSDVLGQMVKV